jgi:hypothetical protein
MGLIAKRQNHGEAHGLRGGKFPGRPRLTCGDNVANVARHRRKRLRLAIQTYDQHHRDDREQEYTESSVHESSLYPRMSVLNFP